MYRQPTDLYEEGNHAFTEDKLMTTKILGLQAQAGAIQPATPLTISLPANREVSLGWKDGDNHDVSYMTAESLASVTREEAPSGEEQVYVLIQEGGTSFELYIHAHGSREEAEDDRVSCEDNGAYRTSDIIEVPSSLADQPGFYELAEQLVCSAATIRSPFTKGCEAEVKVPESFANHPRFNAVAEQLVGAISTLGFPGDE
ncbi:hypothetical protein WJ97_11625 [Burkholderia ubonensis]|nr:hypothetical protein WJ93_24430 [Burkholderia ubonensis]KVP96528.1 hypothetical protein WJ97_11625 [Burkholderia ubonensis]